MPDDKKPVKEADFKKLILKEYTFLKRPAAIIDGEIIVGNDKIAVAALIKALQNSLFAKKIDGVFEISIFDSYSFCAIFYLPLTIVYDV